MSVHSSKLHTTTPTQKSAGVEKLELSYNRLGDLEKHSFVGKVR